MHEFLHAAGVFHEHQRSDRDRYIEVFTDRVEEKKWARDLKKIRTTIEYSPYDVLSIMHYGSSSFVWEDSFALLHKDGSEIIGNRRYLTRSDRYGLFKMYVPLHDSADNTMPGGNISGGRSAPRIGHNSPTLDSYVFGESNYNGRHLRLTDKLIYLRDFSKLGQIKSLVVGDPSHEIVACGLSGSQQRCRLITGYVPNMPSLMGNTKIHHLKLQPYGTHGRKGVLENGQISARELIGDGALGKDACSGEELLVGIEANFANDTIVGVRGLCSQMGKEEGDFNTLPIRGKSSTNRQVVLCKKNASIEKFDVRLEDGIPNGLKITCSDGESDSVIGMSLTSEETKVEFRKAACEGGMLGKSLHVAVGSDHSIEDMTIGCMASDATIPAPKAPGKIGCSRNGKHYPIGKKIHIECRGSFWTGTYAVVDRCTLRGWERKNDFTASCN